MLIRNARLVVVPILIPSAQPSVATLKRPLMLLRVTTILPTPSPFLKVVERETEETKNKVQTTRSESTTHVQPLVVQIPIPEPDVAPKPKPSIPYPSRLNDQKLREKTNSQMLNFL
nr:reverse transcriptase domain-containing protein [Tanacetum cinerariifolium]